MKYDLVFNNTEKAVFALRELFSNYGFKQYKMSKFEEYDLYAKNKDFLLSENVITFTDTDGHLMALKPDVTLSIIKNGKDKQGLEKVFYNETVYRVSKGTKSFKEFMQVGLECFGDIDEYEIVEVLYLATQSLKIVSDDYLLDISHLDFVKGLFNSVGLSYDGSKKVIKCLAEKNAQGVFNACIEQGLSTDQANLIKSLVSIYGNPKTVIEKLYALKLNEQCLCSLQSLENIVNALCDLGVGDKIRIDFSVVNDMNYYNGMVFNGFISGIPTSILSGGQYDNLMGKMQRKDKAIGFAVYLDELEKLVNVENDFDTDVAIEYGNCRNLNKINTVVKQIIDGGERVFSAKIIPEKLKYRRLIKIKEEN